MPRIQLYLPDPLYKAVKDLDLPASELLQNAVTAELTRRAKLAELDTYITELEAEVGPPSEADLKRAAKFEKQLNAALQPK